VCACVECMTGGLKKLFLFSRRLAATTTTTVVDESFRGRPAARDIEITTNYCF